MKKKLKKLETPQKYVPDFLIRDRIVNLFNEAINYKVIFVSSMSGCGKTVEVISWSKQSNKKTYFINFKKGDTCKTICKKINKECHSSYATLDEIASKVNKNSRQNESVIILDNFEYVVNNKDVLNYMINIIQNSSNELHFIIISEGGLPNEFKHFLFAKNLIYIKNKELAFTENEIMQYLEENNCILTSEQLDKIYKYSAGLPIYLNSFLCRYNDNNQLFNDELFDGIKKDMAVYLDYKLSLVLLKKYNTLLLKMARFEDLNIEIMSKIITDESIAEVLEKIYNATCILQEKDVNEYLIKEFYKKYYLLKTLSEEDEKELEKYYIMIAEKCIENGNSIQAVNYYIKAKKYNEAIDKIKELSLSDVESIYNLDILNLLEEIPTEYAESSIVMTWYLYIKAVMKYDIKEITKMYEKISKLVSSVDKNAKEYYETIRIGFFAKMILPSNTPRKLLKPLKKIIEEQRENLKYLPVINITENQPTLLAGRKDFSQFSLHADLLRPIFLKMARRSTFIKMHGFVELLNGEVCYQRNNINEALDYIGKGLAETRKNSNYKLEFPGDILNLKILFLTSKLNLFDKLMFDVKNKFKNEKDKLFLKNLEAEKIRFDLKSGKIDDAAIWLEKEAPNIIESFNILEKYRYTIKARVYIALEEYTGALIILKRLEPYFSENERIFNMIENYILQSICFEKSGDEIVVFEYIEKAILLAQKYGYIRVFADEGLLVNKILIRYKEKCKEPKVNLSFLNEIINETKIFGDKHPLLYIKNKSEKLVAIEEETNNLKIMDNMSSSEKNILKLICDGLKNREIAEKMSISMSTVKTHINHIFSKLNVDNRVQAINEAKKRNII